MLSFCLIARLPSWKTLCAPCIRQSIEFLEWKFVSTGDIVGGYHHCTWLIFKKLKSNCLNLIPCQSIHIC